MAAHSPPAAGGFHEPDAPAASAYDRCVRCGLCLPACPTYLETLVETSGPRGRIALIKSVAEGRIDLTSPGFMHQMSECLDCRACEAVCPSGVPYGALVEPARAQIERATAQRRTALESAARAFALALFRNLALMRAVAALVRFYQRSGMQRFARGSGLLRGLKLETLEALAPPISSRFFSATGAHHRAAGGTPKSTAFMHVGCVMPVAFAHVNDATVRVLVRSGVDVVVPRGQGCCGAIAVHAGEPAQCRALAKRNIAAFERSGADFYVVNAAGCGSTLKEYGELFAEDAAWRARAQAFAERVRDVTEFLDAVGLAPELGSVDCVATYQEPCHLVHAQRISSAPRRLLSAIPGLRLREMHESAVCCGSAGTYALTQPVMSRRLRDRKVENVVATAPDVVLTANPGCALQLQSGIADAGRQIKVKHIVEIIDEAYAPYIPVSRPSPESAASTLG